MASTSNAEKVCRLHYVSWRARENGCDRCPINKQCITTKAMHTHTALDEWRRECEEAATRFLAASK